MLYQSYPKPGECPFCETVPADRPGHIRRCHKDRIEAQRAYDAALAAGRPIEEARATYNAAMIRAEHRPGGYDRGGMRKAREQIAEYAR